MKTRIQAASDASDEEKLSILGILERILREEGVMGYYRGFLATMLNTFSMRKPCLLRPTHSVQDALTAPTCRIRVLLLLLVRPDVVHQAPRC